LNISRTEFKKRRKMWIPVKSRYKNGVLAKYMLLARSASEGAITIPQLK